MSNYIYNSFQGNFPNCHFIRFGDNRDICIYIGRDDKARYSLEFRGVFKPVRLSCSDVIVVDQYKEKDLLTLRFSLENNDLLEYFCTFCQDLLESVKITKDDVLAYHTLCSRYNSWKRLFKPNNSHLSETEIMGLIGELLFLKNYMIPEKGIDEALESWMGPEKTHKDFSNKQEWFEVKTINFGKESVCISSIEQLDSDKDGVLVVYELEKMSPSYEGIRLNQLVNSIIVMMNDSSQRDIFIYKLQLFGFEFSNENDNLVFVLKNKYKYKVDAQYFPRLHRSLLPNAITRVQYNLLLTEIEPFKIY